MLCVDACVRTATVSVCSCFLVRARTVRLVLVEPIHDAGVLSTWFLPCLFSPSRRYRAIVVRSLSHSLGDLHVAPLPALARSACVAESPPNRGQLRSWS